ncbi:SGNH/GDSL hydrolase family protein [Paenibacillus pasadenensis]|uniref:SGNH/GDSL hydrolase family protein n=1 Tax=Paenibacillus TaxID=44249 RepID=UPI0004035DD3|nr:MULTISPECIES: SGNH/GDSL hydrolase family protein [Paenibacillus]QGG56759.1 GDSL family lipase [Paenibacillus sp. B01]
MTTLIQEHSLVLFQGDSITDAGRDRGDAASLGAGYALLAAGRFGSLHAEKGVRFLNRGIGGDRVADLQERWERDCLELRPDWLSIYIGINDTWRRYDSGSPTTAQAYKDGYRRLIERALEASSPRLVLVEPFVLPVNEGQKAWREDLDPKIQAVRELAGEYKTLYVPLDGLFAQAAARTGPAYWAPDGVHPSAAGAALIAEAWLKAVQAI